MCGYNFHFLTTCCRLNLLQCWLPQEDCVCSKMKTCSLWNKLRIWLYMHPKVWVSVCLLLILHLLFHFRGGNTHACSDFFFHFSFMICFLKLEIRSLSIAFSSLLSGFPKTEQYWEVIMASLWCSSCELVYLWHSWARRNDVEWIESCRYFVFFPLFTLEMLFPNWGFMLILCFFPNHSFSKKNVNFFF